MPRWDLKGVALDQFDRRAVDHLDMEVPRNDVTDVMDLTRLRTNDGLYMLRPAPPRLEDRAPDRKLAEFHKLDAGLLDHSDLIRPVKPLPAQLHNAIVRGSARRWQNRPVDEEVIPILRVRDAAATAAWYARLGFAWEWEHRFEPGFPAFVSVVRDSGAEHSDARGRMHLFLSEHTGDAHPDTLIYLRLADVDGVAREFGVEVEDAPWAREIELRDPDGNRLRIGTPTSSSNSS